MSVTSWVLVVVMPVNAAWQMKPAPAPLPPLSVSAQQPEAETLPVSIARIRRGLSQQPTINTDRHPVFRVEVFGRTPSVEDLLGSEFWKGPAPPAPGSGMTHQEFLATVTPDEFQGTAMFTQGEAISLMVMTVMVEWAFEKLLQKLERARQKSREAKSVRARDEARKEVQEALAALDRARTAAGLPRRLP